MSSFSDIVYEFLDFVDSLVKWLSILLAAAMVFVVIMQVFARYLPTPTPPWTEELARYLMIYMAFIGASHGIKNWNNIRVDYFINKLPNKARKALEIAIQLGALVLIVYIAYLSFTVFPVVGYRQYSATLKVPMFYAQLAIPIGFVLMALQLIGVLLRPLLEGEGKT